MRKILSISWFIIMLVFEVLAAVCIVKGKVDLAIYCMLWALMCKKSEVRLDEE